MVTLKATSTATLLLLFAAMISTIGHGYALTDRPTQSPTIHIRFDAIPRLISDYPQTYRFSVGASTTSGLWVTNLHWDFGDGSTLDVPFSGRTLVNDTQDHAYSQAGLYSVSVVASDNVGDSGSANVTVPATTPVPPV